MSFSAETFLLLTAAMPGMYVAGLMCRYLSDVPLSHIGGRALQQQALKDAAEYYLKAQQLDASVGMIYNQLGAVLELKDGATNSVCLGACMHFGIAATAQVPARSGIANFRRSIGIHRNALQLFLNEHALELPERMQSRFVVCFGSNIVSDVFCFHEAPECGVLLGFAEHVNMLVLIQASFGLSECTTLTCM